MKQINNKTESRRGFLKKSGVIAAGLTAAGSVPRVHAAGDETIKIALIGCGGRGTGAAANALSTKGPVKLVAMADVFPHRLNGSHTILADNFAERVDVPEDRRFIGLDAYKHAIDAVGKGGVALLCTGPAFRPIHLDYAVDKNLNVFMEKSFAVDGPGIRRVLAAGKRAEEKNLKIGSGLMSRHSFALQKCIEEIHENNAIGDPVTCWAYREHGPVGFTQKPEGWSELAHQINNYSCFTWMNGTFLLDWLIHNLDVSCWAMGDWPVSAQGHGGRQVRMEPDQLFDHYAVEYTFPNGTRLMAQGRHQDNTWGFFGIVLHGTKGSAVLGEGISRPKIYKGYNQTEDFKIWEHNGDFNDQYQTEHDILFDAIRTNKPHNETQRAAYAALTGILGRMASESGHLITWEQALNSNLELAPGLEDLTWDGPAPVMPDVNGKYPIAMPGISKVL
ncbi:MAG: Gfo/Idh/MocA family protein [Thermoguttaceae bacterium]